MQNPQTFKPELSEPDEENDIFSHPAIKIFILLLLLSTVVGAAYLFIFKNSQRKSPAEDLTPTTEAKLDPLPPLPATQPRINKPKKLPPALLPPTPRDFYIQGMRDFEQGRYQKALTLFKQSHSFNPNNANVKIAIGRAYLALREFAQAEAWFVQALSENKQHAFHVAELYIEAAKQSSEDIKHFLTKAILCYQYAAQDPALREQAIAAANRLDQRLEVKMTPVAAASREGFFQDRDHPPLAENREDAYARPF